MSRKYYAPRSCYEFVKDKAGRDIRKTGELSSYRDCPAYVLLGQPGSGKTTAFEQEATQPDCKYVSARDFITFDVNPDWRDKTLFIDGLDEVRAGQNNALTSFDEIRKKLRQLGQSRFRLSCREADWYGATDRKELAKVSPDGAVHQLFLAELEDEDMLQVLVNNYHKTESEASSFLEEARRRELTDLIKNPQTLEMLVTAVAGGTAWPERKSDVFKLACEKLLLVEWNKAHNMANHNQSPPVKNLMRKSGRLCAAMLLARKDGFVLSRSDESENYPFIADMADDDLILLQLVARTRLFTTRDEHTEYSHRIFAEYLSAYYLSNKIDNEGLPVGRVLALMTGNDGVVVSELRGVYAWLATLCHKERAMLMQRDPLGVVLYGDISLFSKEDRLKLLHELSKRAENTGEVSPKYLDMRSFGALCQSDMERDYRSILESTDPGDAHQFLLKHVLASMTHGKALPGLSDDLVRLLRNPGCRLGNRIQAIQELIRFGDEQVLLSALTDIEQNVIPDPNDDLLGKLLRSLYPHRIKPSEIFKYLHPRKQPNYFGSYFSFWVLDLDRKAIDAQIIRLLDSLVELQAVQDGSLDSTVRREIIGNLLARGIEIFSDSYGAGRLSSWLDLGIDEHGSISLSGPKVVNRIRDWLKQRPQVQKNLVEHHLDKCSKENDFGRCALQIRNRLFRADLPEDYGRWCLDKAKTSNNEDIRRFFFTESLATLVTGAGNTGMSLELVEEAVAKDSCLKQYWNVDRVREIKPEYSRFKQERKQHMDEQDQAKNASLQFIRNNLREIEAGTAEPWIFSKLGSAYFGYSIESMGNSPLERLMYFFENDKCLVKSVLLGLIRFIVIDREDIPDVAEIFELYKKDEYFVCSHPYRAGMNELAEVGNQHVLQLGEDKIAKALAFYYVDATGEETSWYKTLVKERPDLVARLFVQFGAMELRAGKNLIIGTYSLAFEENHRQVARLAALSLLESFRTRSTSKQLAPLYELLIAALRHADRDLLRGLVEKKLALKGMNAAQRVLWLTTGLILDPERFAQRLTEFVSRKEARMNYLSGFLSYRSNQWLPVDELPLQAVASLIRLLGPCHAPVVITDDDVMSGPSFVSSELIAELIARLAVFPTDEATGAIENLLESDQLTRWHPLLNKTLHTQLSAKREAMFRHADLKQVLDTLKNGPPANVADLACITHERIRELAERIKYGNTNDFRQYWEKYPEKRQHEETCRDRFLSDLKPLLANVNVNAQSESRYASERRADVQVSFAGSNGYNIPIEIKCNDSKDLWHGIRKQLIERYTIDPGAHGYGIYLVFWFGYEKTTPHPDSGPKPRTPAELEERLNRLLKNDKERKKISVCVVDCTAD